MAAQICSRTYLLISLIILLFVGYRLMVSDSNLGEQQNGGGRPCIPDLDSFPPEIKKSMPSFCQNLDPIVSLSSLPTISPSARLNEINGFSTKESFSQDDPKILNYMWDHCDVYLRPPDGVPTKYTGPNPSMGQDEVVLKILNNKRGGFFVEVGGYDGVVSSNTLELERKYGWKGLVIEPDPSNLFDLHRNHRNCWVSHSCLTVENYPHGVSFQPSRDMGKVSKVLKGQETESSKQIHVQCFPFFSFMAALGVDTVDFFSLDVEGLETKILNTIPFDRILIKVFSIEVISSKEDHSVYKNFMESKGYRTVGAFYHEERLFDLVFAHKSIDISPEVYEMLDKPKPKNPQWKAIVKSQKEANEAARKQGL